MHPECVLTARGIFAPQLEDPICGDDLVWMDQEQCEKGLLSEGPEIDGCVRTLVLERAQDLETHATNARHVHSSNHQIRDDPSSQDLSTP